MNKSHKFQSIIKSFSREELTGFKMFLQSPVCNNRPQLLDLYEILETDFDRDKEAVWKQLFPSKPYTDNHYRKLLSDLAIAAENFFAFRTYFDDDLRRRADILPALRSHNLDRYFQQNYKKIQKEYAAKWPNYDAQMLLARHFIEVENYSFVLSTSKRTTQSNLQGVIDYLDYFYFLSKLKYLCEVLCYKNVVDVDYQLRLGEEIIQFMEEAPFNEIPVFKIYTAIWSLYKENQTNASNHFKQLKKMLQDYGEKLPKEEVQNMFNLAQNYCIQQANLEKPHFLEELYDLYQIQLDTQTIFINQYIPHTYYKNITTTGLKLGKLKATESFIRKYKKHIDPQFREDAYHFNLAALYYTQKDFAKMRQTLQKVEFLDDCYSLGAKTLIFKSYWETWDL